MIFAVPFLNSPWHMLKGCATTFLSSSAFCTVLNMSPKKSYNDVPSVLRESVNYPINPDSPSLLEKSNMPNTFSSTFSMKPPFAESSKTTTSAYFILSISALYDSFSLNRPEMESHPDFRQLRIAPVVTSHDFFITFVKLSETDWYVVFAPSANLPTIRAGKVIALLNTAGNSDEVDATNINLSTMFS